MRCKGHVRAVTVRLAIGSVAGYLALKALWPTSVWVALEDWPQVGADAGGRPLARVRVEHPGGGAWLLRNFTLVPNASSSCKPFPFDTAPLSCSIPRSQSAAPASATADCVACGGTLTITLDNPGAEVSTGLRVAHMVVLGVSSNVGAGAAGSGVPGAWAMGPLQGPPPAQAQCSSHVWGTVGAAHAPRCCRMAAGHGHTHGALWRHLHPDGAAATPCCRGNECIRVAGPGNMES